MTIEGPAISDAPSAVAKQVEHLVAGVEEILGLMPVLGEGPDPLFEQSGDSRVAAVRMSVGPAE
jgi:hypothetical protein